MPAPRMKKEFAWQARASGSAGNTSAAARRRRPEASGKRRGKESKRANAPSSARGRRRVGKARGIRRPSRARKARGERRRLQVRRLRDASGRRGVFAHDARADGGAGLGSARFRLRVGRCVRRPSLVRPRHHHASARIPRLQGRRHRPARLERRRLHRRVRRAAVGLPRIGRQHGFDGEPLHGGEEASSLGRLHAGRRGRGGGRTMRRWCTRTSFAARTRRRPSSSAASRRAFAA